jgi:hypothetical protein
MKSLIPFEAGVFYELGQGYATVFADTPPATFELGNKFQINSMFELWELKTGEVHVGFYLYSGFTTTNGYGYLATFMEAKRGKAATSELLVRHPHLMVYSFPGCGALAVTTKVSERMLSILLEQ